MERVLTASQKLMIAAIVALLVGGAAVRLYYARAELARTKVKVQQLNEAAPALAVHVKGAVRSPGLVAMRKGARVQDAIEAAGGLADGADADAVNLAAFVKDGEEIYIPGGGGAASVSGAPARAGVEKLKPGQKININKASAADLQRIPGVGPAFAARIAVLRERRGPFRTTEEIMLVQGIGESKYKKIKDFITVEDK